VLGWIPFREVILSVAVLLLIGENFPFSNFPMYSSLEDESFYFVVTNSKDEILPYATVFRFRASFASKSYKTEYKKLVKSGVPKEEASRQSAAKILDYMVARAEPSMKPRIIKGGLKFTEVRTAVKNGELIETRTTFAEVPPR